MFGRIQQQFASRIAVISSSGRQYSYRQLLRDSARLSQQLAPQRGQTKDSSPRIAYWAQPGYEYCVANWAVWRAGAIAVPLCVSHPRAEVEYVLRDAQVSKVIASAPLDSLSLRELSAEVGATYIPLDPQGLGVSSDDNDDSVTAPSDNPSSDPALIIYTSGTTGKPKGVVSSHGALRAQMEMLGEAWEWSKDDHILNALPLHHIHGVINALYCAHWAGAKVTFLEKFNAEEVWRRFVNTPDLNVWMAVPTMYAKMIQAYDSMPAARQQECSEACRRFRLMVSGSMALPQAVLERWREISGHTLLERYGTTEICMVLSNPLHGHRKVGFVGKPLRGVQAKIVDDEILIKSPSLFLGYWGREKATKECFDAEGWFKTGDSAMQDEDGDYRILGRLSADILKVGGYKISALDIEQVLLENPLIAEVAVVGIPDDTYGQVIGAIVVLKQPDPQWDIGKVKEWCQPRLAHYKIPRRLVVMDSIPRNAMGKVNKRSLVAVFQDNKR